ncbi:MAG: hypothetical protein ABSE06_06955 [Anaerolineaceae bacterium]
MSIKIKCGVTQRALDSGDCRFAACSNFKLFLASSLYCSQSLSTPAHLPVMQTVGWLYV